MSSDAFFLLYARLDGGNSVRVRNLQRDGLASQQLDENLHISILEAQKFHFSLKNQDQR